MALQSFCCSLAVIQFLNLIHSRWGSLDGRSASRKAATYTHNNTNTDIYALSGIRTQDPSFRATEERAATVISKNNYRLH
jgi:hypothetical protein